MAFFGHFSVHLERTILCPSSLDTRFIYHKPGRLEQSGLKAFAVRKSLAKICIFKPGPKSDAIKYR